MNCPVCNVSLQMTTRDGVEIDYCPKCRGVWLDRGELDKVIERAGVGGGHDRQEPRYEERPRHDDDDDDDRYRQNYGHDSRGGHHGKHKKEGFLGDLFDF